MNHEDWEAHQRLLNAKGYTKRVEPPKKEELITMEQIQQMARADTWIFWICLTGLGFIVGLLLADYLEVWQWLRKG